MKAAEDTDSLGDFIHHIGRLLFKEGQFDELDRELAVFLASSTTGTAASYRNAFYRQRLPGLINNYIFPEYADFSGQIKWMDEFPRLIEVINPLYVSNSPQEWILVEYLAHCSHRNVSLKDIVAEVVTTIKAFVTRHPKFARQ